MKDIKVTRQSSLFKIVAFLSNLPVFSLFIQKEFYSWQLRENPSVENYNTFNDICTFSRHVVFSLVTLLLYMIVFGIVANFLIVQPYIYLSSGTSVAGSITLYTGLFLMLFYLVLLGVQSLFDVFSNINNQREPKPEKEKKEAGVFVKIFQLLSQKHHNFCKRLSVEDDN